MKAGNGNADVFESIRWTRQDIADEIAMLHGPEAVTDENIDAAIAVIGHSLRDISIERGWDVIEQAVVGMSVEEGEE